jgi:hypothetical protein
MITAHWIMGLMISSDGIESLSMLIADPLGGAREGMARIFRESPVFFVNLCVSGGERGVLMGTLNLGLFGIMAAFRKAQDRTFPSWKGCIPPQRARLNFEENKKADPFLALPLLFES